MNLRILRNYFNVITPLILDMKKFGSVGQYRVMVEGMKAHYDHYYAHEGLQHMRYEIKICTFLQGIFV
jgi:hypothetical protein